MVKKLLEQFADSNNARTMRICSGRKFDFYGVRSYRRYKIFTEAIEGQGGMGQRQLEELCNCCFDEAEKREVQYFVNDIVCKEIPGLDASFMETVHELIGKLPGQDTVVGFLAPRIAGPLFLKYPDMLGEYIKKWLRSEDPWYQQAAITYQLYYRHKTDEDILFACIEKCKDTKCFYVKRAAALALQHCARVKPKAVEAFLDKEEDLPPIIGSKARRILRPQIRGPVHI